MKAYNDLTKIYKRIFLAKMIGLAISAAAVLVFIFRFQYTQNYYLLIGVLLWYTTISGLVGLTGVLDYHPTLKIKLYLWRGFLTGGFMNLILVFFTHDLMTQMVNDMIGLKLSICTIFVGAFLEGALIGLIADYITTKKFGEGKQLLED